MIAYSVCCRMRASMTLVDEVYVSLTNLQFHLFNYFTPTKLGEI